MGTKKYFVKCIECGIVEVLEEDEDNWEVYKGEDWMCSRCCNEALKEYSELDVYRNPWWDDENVQEKP